MNSYFTVLFRVNNTLEGIIKRCLWAATLLLGSSLSAIGQICSTDATVAIADGSGSTGAGAPAIATIEVPAFYTNAITDMTFDLRIDHTYIGDLIVTLTSPAGTTVTLMNRPGSPTPLDIFGCSQNNIDATFDDASGTPVESQCPASNPTIQGVLNPDGNLSDFDGETPAGTWTITVTDNAGQDTGSLISTSNCIDLTTVPVVLSSFSSKQRGKRLVTRWQTSSEAFNLGFNIWGNIDGEWARLNNRLIRSGAVDSIEPLNYKRGFNTNKLPSPPTEVGISSLSSSGFEEFYGPFELGEQYGEATVSQPIDWTAQREKYELAMQNAGFEWRNNRWRKVTTGSQRRANRLKQRYPDAWLRIEQDGVYRLTHEMLLAQGIDLTGMPLARLAITHAGKAIARSVTGSVQKPKRFGPGSEIVFYAQTPKGASSRYVNYSQVRLSADASKVLNTPVVPADADSAPEDAFALTSHTHLKKINLGQPAGYSFIIPGDTPWYDEVIYAFGDTGRKEITFTVDPDADLSAPFTLKANLMGGTSFDNIDADGDGVVEPDHHFIVYLNRAKFPKPIYEGYSEKVDAVEINATVEGQLVLGSNTLEIEVVPDNGHNIDAAYFLSAQVSYQSANNFDNSTNRFALSADQNWVSFNDPLSQVERIYSYDSDGNFAELTGLRQGSLLTFRAPPAIDKSSSRTAWLSNEQGYLTPSEFLIAPSIDESRLDLQEIDYVVIAEPSLMGDDLERYIARQNELGRRTKIVSTHDIFAKYSDGLATPQAIARYLRDAAYGNNTTAPSPFQHVLLVGGHTYNYLGHNVSAEEQPINLIPSFYRNGVGTINRQIPTAVPFVDFDQDGAPDRAIGRWPVRDIEQLKLVVYKTLAWHQDGSHKSNQQVLLLAQKDEELNNFSGSLERLSSVIGHTSNPWLAPNRMYVSDVLADDTIEADKKIAVARERLIDGINQGPALTVYGGHASPTSWGRENLLTTSVVDAFTNTATPSLIVPLACYTTYYETPNVKSLSERLFSDNAAGAVGLSGPALLSYTSENERFAKTLLRLMSQQGHDLGTAVMLAKQAFHGHGDRKQTVIYNWVTLADPTLSFDLPEVIEVIEPNDDAKRGIQ